MIDALSTISIEAANRPNLWCRMSRDRGVRCMARLGVWRGEFAQHVLRDCPNIASYFMIDQWRPLPGWNKPTKVSAYLFADIHRLHRTRCVKGRGDSGNYLRSVFADSR